MSEESLMAAARAAGYACAADDDFEVERPVHRAETPRDVLFPKLTGEPQSVPPVSVSMLQRAYAATAAAAVLPAWAGGKA